MWTSRHFVPRRRFARASCLLAASAAALLASLTAIPSWSRSIQRNKYQFVAFSPDGKLFATSHADGTIRLWNVKTRQVQQTLTSHAAAAGRVAFSPDGNILAARCVDGTIQIWDIRSGREVRTIVHQQRWPRALTLLPDGKTIVSATLDATLKEWDIDTGKLIWDSESRK